MSARKKRRWYDGSDMKRKAEYMEGPEAAVNFERAMRGLFQIPHSETPERPKRSKRRKRGNGKQSH